MQTSRKPIAGLFRLLLLLSLVTQSIACKAPTSQDLIGTWEVDYDNSKLTLTLNRDGTFEELFQKNGERSVVRRIGKWELTEFEGPTISLNGALIVDDRTGTIDSKLSDGGKGGWLLHVNKTFGHLNLVVNEDLGLYFEKASQK